MERNNEVDLQVLRAVIGKIFDFMEKDLKLSSVELPNNFYWSIDDERLYKTTEKPNELDVGSLVDDWEFVVSAWNHPDRALPGNLLHVAPLLRALAMSVPSYAKR